MSVKSGVHRGGFGFGFDFGFWFGLGWGLGLGLGSAIVPVQEDCLIVCESHKVIVNLIPAQRRQS